MSSIKGQGSGKGKDRYSTYTQDLKQAIDDGSPQAKFDAANADLLELEEELDVLTYCARELRKERTRITQGRLIYPNELSDDPQIEDSDKLVEKYLSLASKGKELDAMIKSLKEECASGRSECNYLASKLPRTFSWSKFFETLFRGEIHGEHSIVHGGPESGFADRDAIAERILLTEDTATSVGAVVGAFGAGVAYTTLFSATRGRLDLISWAFTCFLIVIISCGALQIFALPQHNQLTRIFRMEYVGSAENRLLVYILFVGFPMVSGFVLLAVSVALLDANSDNVVPGSQVAIRVGGYLPVAFLGYFVIAMIVIALGAILIRLLSRIGLLTWPTEGMPEETRKHYPSLLWAVKDKLYYLPGGEGYSQYRKKRRPARTGSV